MFNFDNGSENKDEAEKNKENSIFFPIFSAIIDFYGIV